MHRILAVVCVQILLPRTLTENDHCERFLITADDRWVCDRNCKGAVRRTLMVDSFWHGSCCLFGRTLDWGNWNRGVNCTITSFESENRSRNDPKFNRQEADERAHIDTYDNWFIFITAALLAHWAGGQSDSVLAITNPYQAEVNVYLFKAVTVFMRLLLWAPFYVSK